MRKEPFNKLSNRALVVWRISSAMSMVFFLLVAIAVLIVTLFFDWPIFIGIVLIIFVLLLSIFSVWFYPKWQWKKWRYEVHESEIDIQHGVFVVKRTLIPMVRVQHVDTQQGPLLRRYQLATVTISTAATIHEIPALDEEEAEQLRDRISTLAKVVDEHD
ncbi:PH domain-containing protein [Bacillus pinisoli]|uniref:PH domain-containing protein n=1 Tax=Bacillus pinisoli TaxID=2901866 RepID=UPI001FF25D47|nr:PH domain-containing protein [Bacillus pinisoli]